MEKILMLGKIESKRRRGWQKMRWFDGITNSLNINLSKLQEIIKDRETRYTTVYGVPRSRTPLNNWTTKKQQKSMFISNVTFFWWKNSVLNTINAYLYIYMGFLGGSEVKASAWNVGDLGSIPGSGRPPGERNGNLLQYYCLENPMEGGTWWATVHGVPKSRTQLSDLTFTFIYTYLYMRINI